MNLTQPNCSFLQKKENCNSVLASFTIINAKRSSFAFTSDIGGHIVILPFKSIAGIFCGCVVSLACCWLCFLAFFRLSVRGSTVVVWF